MVAFKNAVLLTPRVINRLLRFIGQSISEKKQNLAARKSAPKRPLQKKEPVVKIAHIEKKQEKIYKMSFKTTLLYKLKFFLFGIFTSLLFIFLPILFLIFITDLPNPRNLTLVHLAKTTKLYDRNNNLLYEIYTNQNRTLVKLPQIPKDIKDATIAIEDKDFYNHPGFDLRGIARAFLVNVRNEGFQGGSTITQQLIKAAFLTPQPSVVRKIKEVVLAFWAERVYGKDQILELYFNYVPYGGTAWGVEAASQIYFNKKVSDLTLAESAFLAGLPPGAYDLFSLF